MDEFQINVLRDTGAILLRFSQIQNELICSRMKRRPLHRVYIDTNILTGYVTVAAVEKIPVTSF